MVKGILYVVDTIKNPMTFPHGSRNHRLWMETPEPIRSQGWPCIATIEQPAKRYGPGEAYIVACVIREIRDHLALQGHEASQVSVEVRLELSR